jgi:hypothetical protein
MITIEEFKQALDSLSPEVHNQAKELVKTQIENMNRISEEPELDTDESDDLEQIADEAKSKLLTLLFGPLYIYFVLEYYGDATLDDEEESFIEDLYEYYFK